MTPTSPTETASNGRAPPCRWRSGRGVGRRNVPYRRRLPPHLPSNGGERDHEHEDLIYLSSTGATEHWNVFAEIEREADFVDISLALFP